MAVKLLDKLVDNSGAVSEAQKKALQYQNQYSQPGVVQVPLAQQAAAKTTPSLISTGAKNLYNNIMNTNQAAAQQAQANAIAEAQAKIAAQQNETYRRNTLADVTAAQNARNAEIQKAAAEQQAKKNVSSTKFAMDQVTSKVYTGNDVSREGNLTDRGYPASYTKNLNLTDRGYPDSKKDQEMGNRDLLLDYGTPKPPTNNPGDNGPGDDVPPGGPGSLEGSYDLTGSSLDFWPSLKQYLSEMFPSGYDANSLRNQYYGYANEALQNTQGYANQLLNQNYDTNANTLQNLMAALRKAKASGLYRGANVGQAGAEGIQAAQAMASAGNDQINSLNNEVLNLMANLINQRDYQSRQEANALANSISNASTGAYGQYMYNAAGMQAAAAASKYAADLEYQLGKSGADLAAKQYSDYLDGIYDGGLNGGSGSGSGNNNTDTEDMYKIIRQLLGDTYSKSDIDKIEAGLRSGEGLFDIIDKYGIKELLQNTANAAPAAPTIVVPTTTTPMDIPRNAVYTTKK